MSTLQLQILQSVEGLSDIQLQSVLEMIKSFKKALDVRTDAHVSDEIPKTMGKKRQLGILKGKTLIAEGYDFDESNAEIARMFGVTE